MEIFPIKTQPLLPPKDDIYDVIDKYVTDLREGDVLVITSKIVAIHQGRCIPVKDVANKNDLVEKEAELLLSRREFITGDVGLTIKGNTLIAFAGIDESNANGYYILWPNDPFGQAKEFCGYLKEKFSIKNLAVIISDSHCVPMRRGTMGISIGYHGLEPTNDYRKKPDIFGREMKITQANVVDALTSASVVAMGEGDERQPMAIVRGADFVNFTSKDTSRDLAIPLEEDLFYPLLKPFNRKN